VVANPPIVAPDRSAKLRAVVVPPARLGKSLARLKTCSREREKNLGWARTGVVTGGASLLVGEEFALWQLN
jgi:hypothetical protein